MIEAQVTGFYEPMSFSVHQEHQGNAAVYYVLAMGEIVSSTPDAFSTFYEELKWKPTAVWFHSPGGSVEAALELGRRVRALGLGTRTGGFYTAMHDLASLDTLVSDSKCLSSCAYAFAGGTVRYVTNDQAIGVHQFKSRSGTQESRAQTMMSDISVYLEQMGVGREFIDYASSMQPDGISFVSRSVLYELNYDNTRLAESDWGVSVYDQNGSIQVSKRIRPAFSDNRVDVAIRRKDYGLVLRIAYSKPPIQFNGAQWDASGTREMLIGTNASVSASYGATKNSNAIIQTHIISSSELTAREEIVLHLPISCEDLKRAMDAPMIEIWVGLPRCCNYWVRPIEFSNAGLKKQLAVLCK